MTNLEIILLLLCSLLLLYSIYSTITVRELLARITEYKTFEDELSEFIKNSIEVFTEAYAKFSRLDQTGLFKNNTNTSYSYYSIKNTIKQLQVFLEKFKKITVDD